MSKGKYKVGNWPAYNEGLKQRGSITIWVSEEALTQWFYQQQRKRGGPFYYSDLAIEVCLVVRLVYHLPLRQTQGFLVSLFDRLELLLPVPDYSVVCRRAQTLRVNLKVPQGKTITDIVVDSTGLKVYGEGEWKVRMHGYGKHRTWKKLAIALDPHSQQVQAVELTTNAVDDASVVEDLLKPIEPPLNSFTGDGAYDKDKVRKLLHQRGRQQGQEILQVMPPQKNAVMDGRGRVYMGQRDDDIAQIKRLGIAQWKQCTNYHQRSKAETFMFRYKVILGGSLHAREDHGQKTEVKLGCKILNEMLQLAKPQSERAA